MIRRSSSSSTGGRGAGWGTWWLALVFLMLPGWSTPPVVCAQNEDLTVLQRWVEWSDASNRLQLHLNRLAFEHLARRQETLAALQSAEDWRGRQRQIRETLHRIMGPFPERTPLNPQVLGVLQKDGYRVEKIVFQSQPEFYVTACLFVPDERQQRAPAILNVIGHTGIAFRGASYQQFLLNLVDKGFIVLAMDPIGQGERLQYYDPETGRSVIGGPTAEHSHLGIQAFLTGSCATRYFTWDGIRAIDYLVSRPEVDPERIGVTGLSGGGTQTSYIAAMDDRVAAAAPACYITGLSWLFASIGPQDAEQNFNRGVVSGIDHGDFLAVRAPKPTLVVATTRDFFSIQGTREVVAEASHAFRSLGAEQHLSLAEDDYQHGFTAKNNEATYAFFQQHLDLPGDPSHKGRELLTEEELTITPSGQLISSLGGETVYSLNRQLASAQIASLQQARQEDLSKHLREATRAAKEISGYLAPAEDSVPVFRGRYQRNGYAVEQYVIPGEGNLILPLLLMVPEQGDQHPALIYLHPEGKAAEAAGGGEIERWVQQGYAVLAPDLSGIGELGRVTNSIAFLGVQIGRSVSAIRAADIVRCAGFLADRPDMDTSQLAVIARGTTTIPALHAAAFDDSLRRLILVEPLVSFQQVVMNRFYSVTAGDVVANALTAYDLPDLAASLAPRPLALVNFRDQQWEPAAAELVEEQWQVVRQAYQQADAEAQLVICQDDRSVNLHELLSVESEPAPNQQ
jgi:cephalosporin-C deacetylase-like acetyl esterase